MGGKHNARPPLKVVTGIGDPEPTCRVEGYVYVDTTSLERIARAEREYTLCSTDEREKHNAPAAVGERMDRLPFGGLLRAARAMGHGMARGYETEEGDYVHWKSQPAAYHLNRALRHIALYQAGDTSEEHVGHAISRLLMWAEIEDEIEDEGAPRSAPTDC